MRIGMVLDNEFTGDPRVENEVLALRKAGHDVWVLCFNYGEKLPEEDFHGATIIRNPINLILKKKLVGLNNTIFNFYPIFWKKKIVDFVNKYRIDAIHVHDLWLLEAAFKANKQLRKPMVVDLHENFVHAIKHYKYANTFPGNILISKQKWERYEKKYLSKSEQIIVVIEEAKERLINLGIEKEKVQVVANYVNISEYQKEDRTLTAKIALQYSNYKTAVYTGGFDVHRGLDIVIKGVPRILEKIKNFKLVLVGGGIILEDLKKLVKDLNIQDSVDFPGYLPHMDLVSYVKASNICLIPHRKTQHTDNTIPHKLFQYMLMEKPILASNCDPIQRIVNETESGMIYPFDDSLEFADKAIQMLENDSNHYGVNGKKAVLNKYNWESTSKNLIDIYHSL